MSSQPIWTDSGQGDLLALVAAGSPSTPTADEEWAEFVGYLRLAAATGNGLIEPNTLRPMVRDRIAPRRIGAFTSRALAQGFVEYTGDWQLSDDREGRNGGKPARIMRWLGRPR